MKQMKAVTCPAYGKADVLEVRNVTVPEPKEDELLIKVHHAAITTADALMRQGTPKFARLFLGVRRPKKPIPGTGFAGTIVAKGAKVNNYEVDDVVFGETGINFGAYAEYVCVKATGVLLHLPQGIATHEAALLCDGPLTSFNFLVHLANLQAGQKVLIVGASGSLGTSAIQIAKHLGAEVTAVCSSRNKQLVKELGADHVIDYTQEDFSQKATHYDVIYDAVGKSSFAKAKAVLTARGKYLSPVLSMGLLWHSIFNKGKNGKAALFSATGLSPAERLKPMLQNLLTLHQQGKLKLWVEETFGFSEIRQAHQIIDSERKRGNFVLNVNQS